MTVVAIDDTDSRERGMCTTYLAALIAERLGDVDRTLLVRLNPAVEHKTRGNAALAVHTGADPDRSLAVVRDALDGAETADPDTNPGAVVVPGDPGGVPERVADQAGSLIGALAAAGAWRAGGEWTYECLAYRERPRWGTPREVNRESVFAAADRAYPDAWDTVDRTEGETVCVPHTPGPVLYGIRGEDPDTARAVADRIESEPVARRRVFVTNQGTDAHLRAAALSDVRDGYAYRVEGTVADPPETREGGHVFMGIREGDTRLRCAAFEPTKRFRDRVRALRAGDRIIACGEVGGGTLKLEKFAVRHLVTTERVTPACPDCGRSMESAGRGQGYRCRDCGTHRDRAAERTLERDLEPGWYEVPPCARRHVSKPLVRGGFDAPVHPER
ncbi:tRNA(Ile2) 2-agmatinylcytidine synthetase [Halobacteriales archaeon QS_1_68_17]|nr:MAG: tRNA(Ile2) 2-agmatinylcytidine synthetase [Halobacteriales archaeon QS_1_68_17]